MSCEPFSQERWQASVSSRAYNAGWLAEMPFGQHPVWEEIAAIHAEEGAWAVVPAGPPRSSSG